MSAFSDKNRPPAPVIYSGLNVGTSQFDLPAPIFWGTRRLTTNAIWFNGFTKTPLSGKGKGGGGKSQQAYDYHAALILGLSEGPIDGIQNIWANGSTTTTTTLSNLNLIFSAGTSVAAVWSYLSTNYPSQAIAYRLTAFVASTKIDLGESATIPANDFECNRTSAVSFGVGPSPTSTFIPWPTAPGAPANYGVYAGASFKLLTGAGAGETGTVQSVSAAGVTLASPLATTPAAGDAFTLGFAYVHDQPAGGWINGATHAQSPCYDCLLSDIVTDLLTNPQYGLGFTAADLGPISQYAAYQRAQGLFFSPLLNAAEKATAVIDRWAQLSNAWIYWSGAQLQFVPLADAAVTGNGVTFTPQNDVAYALTLNDFLAETGADAGPVKVTRKDPADCYNRTVLNITDRTVGYISNPFEFKDQTLADAFGLRDNANVQADEICDPGVARIVAQLIGKRAAYIRNTYSFKTSYRYILCLPGTVLTLTEPNIGLNAVRVRVTKISEDDKGQLSFECEEFPGTAATYVAPLVAPAVNTATTPNQYVAPGAVNTPAIVEPNSAFTGGTPKIIVAASGGANWGGCTVNLSFDGTNYSQVGTITNAATQGVLTASLAAYAGANPDTTDTLAIDCTESLAVTAPVSNADAVALRTLSLIAAQPTLSGGAYVVPTNGELLAFGAVATTGTYTANLTYLERGQYGTAAASHASGAQFTLLNVGGTDGTSVAFDLPAQYVGATIYLKLASFNLFGLAQQDLSTCLEYQYTPTGAGYGTGSGGVPGPPTGLTVGTPTASTVPLAWSANAAADNVAAYTVWRAAGTGAAFGSAAAIWTGLALAFADPTVAASTGYTYFLTAANAVGTSANTAGANATTAAGAASPSASTAVTASASPYGVGTPPAIIWYLGITNSSGGALQVNLPASAMSGQVITIQDAAGTAGTHNFTVKSGSTTLGQITANGGSLTVYWNGAAWL
jgi:hypothetical protein